MEDPKYLVAKVLRLAPDWYSLANLLSLLVVLPVELSILNIDPNTVQIALVYVSS